MNISEKVMMKKWMIALFSCLVATTTVHAAEPEGAVAGSLVSYWSVTDDGTRISQDMVTVPILGYETSTTIDDLKISGNLFVQYEDGAIDVLDQNISIESGWLKFFAGHQEFMDYTMGGDYVQWVDNSLAVGDAGLLPGDDVFELTLKNLGISTRIGVNAHEMDSENAAGETATTRFLNLTYQFEMEKFALTLAMNGAKDQIADTGANPILTTAGYNGRVQQSAAMAMQIGLGESVRISLNAQQTDIKLGTAGSEPIADSIVTLVWDQDFTEEQGFTLAMGANETKEGTTNTTQVSQLDFTYVYNIEAVAIFLAYSVTATKDTLGLKQQTGEAGLGLLYGF